LGGRARRVPLPRAVDSVSCRVPARRPGNFHLLAQMKVTKAKGLKTTFVRRAWLQADALFGTPRASARFLPDPSSLCDFIGRNSPMSREVGLDHPCASVHGAAPSTCLAEDGARARMHSAAKFAPSSTRSADRSKCEPPERDAAQAASHAKRKRFSSHGRHISRALTQQTSGQMCIEALCFGDFHLCQQMKVTRPPGRNPATPVGVNVPAPGHGISQEPARC
jgi:hypothetical protein